MRYNGTPYNKVRRELNKTYYMTSPMVKCTWSFSPNVNLTGSRGSMRTGALPAIKKSPRLQLRVMAAVSSSVRGLERLFGRKAVEDEPEKVL